MAYTESHQSLARHPKTLRLMRHLGASRAETIGHLHMFWWWCLDYAPDGDLTPFDNEEISIALELVTACFECNRSEANKTVEEWMQTWVR